ncbi:MAG: hypothetical protein R2880_19015 [Deinococcales bacterium]
MAKTDNPLKQLFHSYIAELTPWLLGQEVLEVSNRNIELPSNIFKSDQVFRVSLKDGKKLLLHLEFEAHDKAQDMAFRMLEYRSRLA